MSDIIVTNADELAQWLIVRAVKADDCYNAAAGRDYGWVKYWQLPDGATFLVVYHANGCLRNVITNSAGVVDPLHWLEDSGIAYQDRIVQTANIRGADKVPAADPNSKGPFGILVTRYLYGPTEVSDLAEDDFARFKDAAEWLDRLLGANYALTRSEIRAPSYRIVNLEEQENE